MSINRACVGAAGRRVVSIVLLSLATGLAGCLAPGDEAGEGEEQLASSKLASTVENGLTKNALTKNALTKNALTKNALTMHSLTRARLMQSTALRQTLETDPDSIMVLRYIYSCAMPAGTSMTLRVHGRNLVFEGQLGVAPEWGSGHCNLNCQRWVSACVLARVNINGESVAIDARGPHPALGVGAPSFTDNEGAYFGNLFDPDPPKGGAFFTCSRVDLSIHHRKRECALWPHDCGMTYAGRCDQACREEVDGVFQNCVGADGEVYRQVVTPYVDPVVNADVKPGPQ